MTDLPNQDPSVTNGSPATADSERLRLEQRVRELEVIVEALRREKASLSVLVESYERELSRRFAIEEDSSEGFPETEEELRDAMASGRSLGDLIRELEQSRRKGA